MATQRVAGLFELSVPLLIRILSEVEFEDGRKGVAVCRLVCKAWLAAVQLYPGTAHSSSETSDLETLLQIMPSLCKLCISHRHHGDLDYSLVRQFSQLTSIELSASSVTHQMNESEGSLWTIFRLP